MNDCKKCKIEMLEDENGMFVCPKCGQFFYPLVNSYDDNVSLFFTNNNNIVYLRLNHFKETVNEVLGLQTKRIPNDIFNFIRKTFSPKQAIQGNITSMRTFLKKHKLNLYIKITNNILVNLKLISPPTLPIHIFETLILKFNDVESRFNNSNCERKNLLPNNYLLYRFFKELDMDGFLPYINLSKNRKLLERYDAIYNQLSP